MKMFNPFHRAVGIAILILLVAVSLWAARRIDQRGYHRAALEYEAQIAVMRAANETAIAAAQADMLLKTDELRTELADAETRLQEILDDDGQDYAGGCGAPVRALRLLDEIR